MDGFHWLRRVSGPIGEAHRLFRKDAYASQRAFRLPRCVLNGRAKLMLCQHKWLCYVERHTLKSRETCAVLLTLPGNDALYAEKRDGLCGNTRSGNSGRCRGHFLSISRVSTQPLTRNDAQDSNWHQLGWVIHPSGFPTS